MTLKRKFKTWVNTEVAKKLDKEPFSSLPLKMRIGLFIMLGAFVIGHGSNIFILLLPWFNHQLSMGGLVHGSLVYVICWWLGTIGLSLAGRDSIKFPIYFLAKFLKKRFSNYFRNQ